MFRQVCNQIPPLTIPEEMLAESLQVFEEACDAVLGV